MNSESVFKDSFEQNIKIHEQCLVERIEVLKNIGEIISNSILKGGKLFLCGNGGSAADAQHLAAELIVRLRSSHNRKAIPAISLVMDTSTLTACGNDYGFDRIFSRPLEALGNSNDCLLVLSTSGNSKNVLEAINKAKELEMKTFAFTGKNKSNLFSLCDYVFSVPSDITARIQECHITAGHALCTYIEECIVG